MRLIIIFLFFCLTLLAENSRLFDTSKAVFDNVRITRYEHKKQIDEKQGIYIFDCSSFICFLLQKVSPEALAVLPIDKGHSHARAKNFYAFLILLQDKEVKSGWMRISSMDAIEVGDIIAWEFDASLGRNNTGHVVIVSHKPIKEENGIYRIAVMDSSNGKHAYDTRLKGTSGLGEGVMWFRTDAQDRPIALHWSDKTKKPTIHAIAMGRVIVAN